MKKYKAFLLALLTCVCGMAFAVGCDGGKEIQSSIAEATITLESETLSLMVGDTKILTYEYTGEKTISWMNSDESVVSMVNGKVKALKEGTATITVTDGTVTDVCVVTVALDEQKLSVEFFSAQSDYYIGETGNVNAKLMQGDIELEHAVFTYFSSNEEILMVSENGDFQALKEGNVSITVFVCLDGHELNVGASKDITVLSNYQLQLNHSSLQLDSIDAFGEEQFNNTSKVEVAVFNRGNVLGELGDLSISYSSSNDSIFSVSNAGVVVANKQGVAGLTVSLTQGEEVLATKTITVNVSSPQVDLQVDTLELPVAEQYQISLESLPKWDLISAELLVEGFSVDAEIIDAEEWLIKLPSYVSGQDLQLLVTTDKIKISIPVDAYVAVRDVEGLKGLYTAVDGFYCLMSNIDMSQEEWNYPSEITFSGYFNGGGYAIDGLTITGNYGLFSKLGEGAKVSDLTLTNVQLTGEYTQAGVLAYTADGIQAENLDIDVAILGQGVSGGLFGATHGTILLKDIEAHVYHPSADSLSCGAVTGVSDAVIDFQNVKVYSSLKICSDVTANNDSSDALNAINEIIVKPKVHDEEFNCYSDEEQAVEISGNQTTVVSVKAYVGAKLLESNSSTFVCAADIETGLKAKEYVEIIAITADNTKEYYVMNVVGQIYLTQDNFQEKMAALPDDSNKVVYLTEDIKMNGEQMPVINFVGTFDGNGFAIKNLKGQLFNSIAGATIQNLALIGSMRMAENGLIAKLGSATATIKNVLVTTGDATGQSLAGGLFRQSFESMTLENVIVVTYSKRNVTDHGYIVGFASTGTTITNNNCYYVVANDTLDCGYLPIGLRIGYINDETTSAAAMVGTFKKYATLIDFEADSAKSLTTELVAMYEKYAKASVVAISSPTDLAAIPADSTDSYYLTTDIDMSGVTWTSKHFAGTFDGRGFAIKNLNGQLFNHLKEGATVQNLALIGSTRVSGQGLLAYVPYANVTINNLIVTTNGNGAFQWTGGIFRQINLASVTLNNVVIRTASSRNNTDHGFITGFASSGMTVTSNNCYYIAANTVLSDGYLPIGLRSGYINSVADSKAALLGTYKRYTTYADFVDDTTKTLTVELASMIEKYI